MNFIVFLTISSLTTMLNYTLDTENIKNVPFNLYEKDFIFVVDGRTYLTNRTIADILSPIIRNSHFMDETVNEFNIKTRVNLKSNDKIDYFKEFLDLSSYEKVDLDENRKNYFSEYFLHLGNFEEYFRINARYYKDITSANAVEYLININQFHSQISKEFKFEAYSNFNVFSERENHKLINFISQNFESINKERMMSLSLETIEQIISNESLQLFDEDSLLLFILNLYEKDVKYSPLFEYVIFSNVQEETLSKFINVFSMENMNDSIWKSIIARLLPEKYRSEKVDKNRYKNRNSIDLNRVIQYHSNISVFDHKEGNDFNGILRHLTKETKGNIHDNGTIEITSNSIAFDNYHPKNLVDYDRDNYYFSKDVSNSFVCFDFKEKSVKISSYSIKSHSDGKNFGHLKNWAIEVSDNGKTWKVIDKRDSCSLLNESNKVVNFPIEKGDDEFHRFVRIRSTGNSWYQYGNHNQFYFSLIEFYGQISND